jgi:hypothetical protein
MQPCSKPGYERVKRCVKECKYGRDLETGICKRRPQRTFSSAADILETIEEVVRTSREQIQEESSSTTAPPKLSQVRDVVLEQLAEAKVGDMPARVEKAIVEHVAATAVTPSQKGTRQRYFPVRVKQSEADRLFFQRLMNRPARKFGSSTSIFASSSRAE